MSSASAASRQNAITLRLIFGSASATSRPNRDCSASVFATAFIAIPFLPSLSLNPRPSHRIDQCGMLLHEQGFSGFGPPLCERPVNNPRTCGVVPESVDDGRFHLGVAEP